MDEKGSGDLYPNLNMFKVTRDAVPKSKKGKHCYKGTEYTVGFKVNREISLTALEFFGPAEICHGNYWVRGRILQTREVKKRKNKLLGFIFGDVSLETVEIYPRFSQVIKGVVKGTSFQVFLPDPVTIRPNLWTDIKFELSGPATECLPFLSDLVEVDVEDKQGVKFNFLTGSNQLPSLYFKI